MEPKSKHLAPQVCELTKEGVEGGKPVLYTLRATWGLNCNRHDLRLDIDFALKSPYADVWRKAGTTRSPELMQKLWPEHVRALTYHLCSLKGPLHYLENSLYLAGTRDCFGWEPGEQRREKELGKLLWKADSDTLFLLSASDTDPGPLTLSYEPVLVEKLMSWGPNKGIQVGGQQLDADGNHLWRIPGTGLPFIRQLDQPPPLVLQMKPYLGVGKARELQAARSAACWLDASDEELSVSSEQLEIALKDRLPTLLCELKAVVESFGLTY